MCAFVSFWFGLIACNVANLMKIACLMHATVLFTRLRVLQQERQERHRMKGRRRKPSRRRQLKRKGRQQKKQKGHRKKTRTR
jgi:hypothetical protein